MKPIHHLQSEDAEIRLAEGKNGVQVELRGEKIDELKYLLSRALNTHDPQKAPKWAMWLVDRL